MKDVLFYVIGISVVVTIFMILFTAIEYLLGINSLIKVGLSAIIADSVMNRYNE